MTERGVNKGIRNKFRRVPTKGHDHNAGPWLPIEPFRQFLIRLLEEDYERSMTAMGRDIGRQDDQIRRWVEVNKWVPLLAVDEVTTHYGRHWTELYDEDDLVSSYEARTGGRKIGSDNEL